jgi:hypothetical protein
MSMIVPAGIVKHLGMAVRENEPIKLFMEEPECDVVQIVDDYCLCRRFAESSGVLSTALEKDIGVVQAAPMYRGMLYDTGRNVAKNPEVTAMIAEMGEWANARNHQLPDLAVQFPARHPALSTCIMGAQSAAEVDGALPRASLSTLCARIPRWWWSFFWRMRNECPGFVANSRVQVAEKTWNDFERDFAQRYVTCGADAARRAAQAFHCAMLAAMSCFACGVILSPLANRNGAGLTRCP